VSQKAIIVTAPSGAGKTTIVKYLLINFPQLAFSVSATTRKQRIGETDGADYYFITETDFKKKTEQAEFVEWEEVYNNAFYGTLQSEVNRLWQLGKVIVFDVDVRGAVHLKQKFGEQALSIFVKPPSEEVLEERLKSRATEDLQKIEERVRKAKEELQFEEYFDESVLNDNLPEALDDTSQLVAAFIRE
jgi:guanylate kinase